MDYYVRNVELYNAVECSADTDAGNGMLRICSTTTTIKNLESEKKECIKYEGIPKSPEIPRGTYLFVQGFIPANEQAFDDKGVPHAELYDAAEKLWLEFIWQNIVPADDKIYVRLLMHEHDYIDQVTGQKETAGTVFQLYRRTQKELLFTDTE